MSTGARVRGAAQSSMGTDLRGSTVDPVEHAEPRIANDRFSAKVSALMGRVGELERVVETLEQSAARIRPGRQQGARRGR